MNPEDISEFQRQVIDIQRQMCKQLKDTQVAMESVSIAEPTLAKPALFHGYENENVDRWLQRFTLYLANRKIKTDSNQAAIQLALHLAGPAESFYYNLSGPVQSSFDELRKALQERFSPAHRSLRLRQALSVRRQGPNESIEKFLADLNEKFSCLDLRDEDKLSYLIQGLRPDIQAEVLKKEPKTYTEAEDTARLIYSIQQSLFQRREEDISRIVLKEKLSSPSLGPSTQQTFPEDNKLLGVIDRNNTVLAELNASLGKLNSPSGATIKASSPTNIASLDAPPAVAALNDAFQENAGNSTAMRSGRDYRHLEDMIQKLAREMDARFRGLARRTQSPRVE